MKRSRIWLINRAVAALILSSLVACVHAPAFATDSGVVGTAVVGPTCPVQRVGGPPCQKPYEGSFVLLQGGRTVATITTDGDFKISLNPGTYTVASTNIGLPTLRPFEVVVKPHAYTTITVMFDSGIR